MIDRKRKLIIWICLLIVGISFIIFYSIVDPSTSIFVPKCLFHELTGYKCIGCGNQRAIYALLHGNFQEALRMNLFIVLLFPVVLLYLFAELFRYRNPKFYMFLNSKYVLIPLGIIALAWWIGRNILGI